MVNSTKQLLLIIGIVAIVPVAILSAIFAANLTGGFYRATFSPYLDYEIAQTLTLTQNWLEISPTKPFRAERQLQEVIINFAEGGEPDVHQSGLKLPSGVIVIPEVELIDEDGKIFTFKAVAFGETALGFVSETKLPHAKKYRTVRIRANERIKVLNVHWKCWNTWDVS